MSSYTKWDRAAYIERTGGPQEAEQRRKALMARQSGHNESGAVPCHLRSPEQFARFFEGLELVEPGVAPVPHWRPDPNPVGVRATERRRVRRLWLAPGDNSCTGTQRDGAGTARYTGG
jgi:hypothetical protein